MRRYFLQIAQIFAEDAAFFFCLKDTFPEGADLR